MENMQNFENLRKIRVETPEDRLENRITICHMADAFSRSGNQFSAPRRRSIFRDFPT